MIAKQEKPKTLQERIREKQEKSWRTFGTRASGTKQQD